MSLSETTKLLRRVLGESGLSAGNRIPSIRRLAAQYQLSSDIVYRSLKQLVKDDFLYSIPQSGLFIKHDPPVRPAIGYVGELPSLAQGNYLLAEAIKGALQYFRQQDCEPVIINYYELQHSHLIAEKLKNLNGLLVSRSHIDVNTRQLFHRFPGKLVVVEQITPYSQLPCSQVVPDFTVPLNEFIEKYPLNRYRQILILRARDTNANALEKIIRTVLTDHAIPDEKIISLALKADCQTAALTAFQRFSGQEAELVETLIISLSSYFTAGLYEAFRNSANLPDILNVGGPEEYFPNSIFPKHYFSALNWQLPQIYRDAAELLLTLIKTNDSRFHTIHIPAQLVIQKSIHATKEPL